MGTFGIKIPGRTAAEMPAALRLQALEKQAQRTNISPYSGMPLDRAARNFRNKIEPEAKKGAAKAEDVLTHEQEKLVAAKPLPKAMEQDSPVSANTAEAGGANEGSNAAETAAAGRNANIVEAVAPDATATGATNEMNVPIAAAETRGTSLAEAEPPVKEDSDGSVLHFKADTSEKRAEQRTAPASERLRNGDEKFLVLRDYCLRGKGVDCHRCAAACPAEAISFTPIGIPHIDHSRCTRCGICQGVCDGFTSNLITPQDLYARMLRAAAENGSVVITCQENIFEDLDPAENVVVVPCLAAVPPQLYTLLLAKGISVIIAGDLSYCEDCDRAPGIGEMLYTAAIDMAQRWSGRTIGFTEEIPEVLSLSQRMHLGGADRRELFTGFATGAADVASGKYRARTSAAVRDHYAMQERMRARMAANFSPSTFNPINKFNGLHTRAIFFPRQEFIYDACQEEPQIAAQIPATVAITDADICCQELKCIRVCPTHARRADEFGNLHFEARYCVGCGLCASACNHGAITMTALTWQDIPTGEQQFGTKTSLEDEMSSGPKKPLDADGE